MKKMFRFCFLVLIVAVVASGCTKTSDTANVTAAPDISDFSIPSVSPVVAGQPSVVTINSTSLGNGTFKVSFDLSGNNADTGLTAMLTMKNNTGTFYTPILNNAGQTILTMNWISNSAGTITPIYYNNVVKFTSSHDSTGLLTATINGSNSFRATDVTSSLSGTLLSINATVWDPSLSTIALYLPYYAHTAGTFSFRSSDTTSKYGSAHYTATGIAQVSSYGSITISAVAPVLTGTFSFTNNDSSKVSGSFSAPSK